MNIALWIVQGLLAFAFIGIGLVKLFAYKRYEAYMAKRMPTGISREMAGYVGAAELVGGFGVVLPMAINFIPAISPWSAVVLASIMLIAIRFHMRGHESSPAVLTLFLMSAFVATGRFSHWA